MYLDRVIHFGETLGDQVKGRSPKKLKSLIGVPNVVHVKVHVLSFNMILILSISGESTCFWLQYDPYLISVACSYTELFFIYFGENLGDKVSVRSPKKQKNLIEVP